MGKVCGRVVSQESSAGLSNLTVSVFGKDPAGGAAGSDSIRLGSSLTDQEGQFEITWSPAERDVGGVLELSLVVSAPEGRDGQDTTIFSSKARKALLTATESYFIEIGAKTLAANGIAVAEKPLDSAAAINTIRINAEEALALETEWRTVAKTRVEARRAKKLAFESDFRERLMREISTFPADLAKPGGLVVDTDPDRTVVKLSDKMLEEGARRISKAKTTIDGSTRRTRYFLTVAQRQKLQETLDAAGADPVLSQSSLEAILRQGELPADAPKPSALSKEDDLFDRFLRETFDESCARDILIPPPDPAPDDDDNGEAPPPPVLTKEVIHAKLARVTADLDAPVGHLAQRPGQEDVIGNIRNFALPPGPADVPAFFDFHKLNIAFDHVWKEFLDDRIEPLSRAAYMAVSEVGGDPDNGGGPSALQTLADEEFLVSAAQVETPPRALYAQRFDPRINSGHLRADGRFDGGFGGGLNGGTGGGGRSPDLNPDVPPGGGGGRPPIGIGGHGVDLSGGHSVVYDPPPRTLIQKLREILGGKYAFVAFGADSKSSAINFGITITYRQRWEPVTYQVGELVRTVTLAPGESKKYSKTMKITRKRAEKEIEKNSSIRRDEFNTTTRAESEIIRKAQSKTNFSTSADGTYNFGIAKGDSTTKTDHDAEKASDETKKSFREAVIKASQEYKQERTLEVSTEDTFALESTDSGEISNPNTELTVTYLFFELQRRFRISEQIYKATPVVLVAQDLPKPNHIDESFLIRHGWILKRALLDDMYQPTLEYVAGPMAGDKVARDALFTAMQDHKRVVETLKDDLYAMKEQASEGYEALRRAVEARIAVESAEERDGFFSDLKESILGGGEDPAAARMREEAARNHEERAVEQVKQLTMALQREISAYTEATEKYTKAQQKHKEWELRIVDLLLHVKENIFHYMQAIWAYEHPDQRFLRLHMKKAPDFVETDGGATYRFLGDLDLTRETVAKDGTVTLRKAVEFEFAPNFEVQFSGRTLTEIADLDTLLGFKGNYMIFPLKDSNLLTDYMLAPYVDAGFRLLDPDDKGNISREDFARYVCYLREILEDPAFEEIRPALVERFRRLILSDPTNGDEIIVPTGSAYIEALPGAKPLLENFKLAHRAFDVLDAQEGVREATLENIRRAARILDDQLSDPDVDARYVIEGAGPVNIGVPDLDRGDVEPDA